MTPNQFFEKYPKKSMQDYFDYTRKNKLDDNNSDDNNSDDNNSDDNNSGFDTNRDFVEKKIIKPDGSIEITRTYSSSKHTKNLSQKHFKKENDIVFSKKYIQYQSLISFVGMTLFFLPWLYMKDLKIFSISGYQLTEYINALWLIPLGFVYNIFILSSKKVDIQWVRSIFFILPAIHLIFISFKFSDYVDADFFGRMVSAKDFFTVINFTPYFYLTIVMIIAMFFINDNK